jgi:hypothetical protein
VQTTASSESVTSRNGAKNPSYTSSTFIEVGENQPAEIGIEANRLQMEAIPSQPFGAAIRPCAGTTMHAMFVRTGIRFELATPACQYCKTGFW